MIRKTYSLITPIDIGHFAPSTNIVTVQLDIRITKKSFIPSIGQTVCRVVVGTVKHYHAVRDQFQLRVMIDRDLATLYQVETKALNQAVRRNIHRFPYDFMFQLDHVELENWKSQIVTSKKVVMGLRKKPLVFTEQGIAMLSSVLNSDLAIQVNIRIIRIFTKIRRLLESNQEILERLMILEKNDEDQEKKIRSVQITGFTQTSLRTAIIDRFDLKEQLTKIWRPCYPIRRSSLKPASAMLATRSTGWFISFTD